MEYYSVLKMNEIVIHATTLFNLEDTMVSEISQSQKGTLCHPTSMKYPASKIYRDRQWNSGYQGLGRDRCGVGSDFFLIIQSFSLGR